MAALDDREKPLKPLSSLFPPALPVLSLDNFWRILAQEKILADELLVLPWSWEGGDEKEGACGSFEVPSMGTHN